MHRKLIVFAVVIVAAGCTTGGAATPGASPAAVATLTATSVPIVSPTAGAPASPADTGSTGGGQPTAGSIDPCSLLTADEASKAVGVKLAAGVRTDPDPDTACTWKSGTTEVKIILAPPAPDAATAQAYWDAARTEVPEGITIKDISGFDRAAFGTGAVSSYSVSALFVIKGTTFFDFYCGLKACTEAASVTAANLIVGRLP